MLKSSVVNELVHRCDVVYHLAAAVGVRLIVEEPVHTLVTNIQGTENVLDHCNRFGKRVLVASTSEVYGDRREPEALAEESRRVYGPTTARRWAYAESKALDEFLALAYHQERGLDCVIARLFNTVGPRQSGQYGMVIPRFVAAALAGRPLEIHGDGIADALLLPRAGHDPRARRRSWTHAAISGEIFNVGSTERVTIDELARRVIELTGSTLGDRLRPLRRGLRPGNRGHAPPAAGDREGRRDTIGWEPTRSLDEILADVHRAHAPGAGARDRR